MGGQATRSPVMIDSEPARIRTRYPKNKTLKVVSCFLPLVMEAVNTFETLASFNETTGRKIPEDSQLHTQHCENLKSQPCTELKVYRFPARNVRSDLLRALQFHRPHKYYSNWWNGNNAFSREIMT
jgi:hypothetical protein